jgi:hypothetical protein|tara:strand:+ start:293 stop:505 length:213 start_codon:yes stop_codon:yes gene_type:complete
MSTEKIMYEEKNQTLLNTPVPSEVKFTGRVDINHLIARARKEKEKENKINLVFFGLISALVLIVGILLSF